MSGPARMAGSAPERKRRDRSGLAAALLAVMAAWGILAPTLFYPPGRDQGVFAYVGRAIAHGGMPYRDAWDLKPPGIYLAYAGVVRAAEALHAPLGAALRGADFLLVALAAVLLVLLARRLGRPWAGPVAAAWYALLYLRGGFWNLSQAEAWANPLLLGAALLGLAAAEDGIPLPLAGCAAGVLLAAAALLKWTAVLAVLPFVALPLWRRGGGRGSWAAAVLAGAAVPLLMVAFWLRQGHAWEPYLEIQRGFVAPYARIGASGPGPRLARLFGYTSGWLFKTMALPTAALLAGALAGTGWSRRARRLLLLSLGGAFLSVAAQDKYFGYHWQPLFPGFALLAAGGSLELGRRLLAARRKRSPEPAPAGADDPRSSRAVVAFALLLAGGGALLLHGRAYWDAARHASGRLSRADWLQRFGPPGRGDFSYLADEWAAAYLRAHTRPGDRVLIWGFEPLVYLLAGRSAPDRFFFNVPLTVRFAPEAWRREFLDDLRRRPPERVLVLRNDRFPWASGRADDSAAQLAEWAELSRWLASRYRREGTIEDFTIYRRVSVPAASPPPARRL